MNNYHYTSIQRRFCAAARTYEETAGVQSYTAQRLIQLITSDPTIQRILEVGCGTGILTRHLIEKFPTASIDALDISPFMIAKAQQQLRHSQSIRWQVDDARHFQSTEPYDMIASNCSLHWMDNLLDGFIHLISLLRHGGKLKATFMLHGTLMELHDTRLRVAPHKPPAGRLPLFNELIDTLELSGFSIQEQLEEMIVDKHQDAESFLRHIHNMGVTGGNVSRAHIPLNRSELKALIKDYNKCYPNEDGGVRATYNVGYIKAVKG